MASVLITGNTYPVKEAIKLLGGKWNKYAKGWHVPAAQAEEARAIVLAAGPVKSRGSRGTRYGSRYSSASLRSFSAPRNRCEDAPCCGCCGSQGEYYGGDY